MTQRIRWHVYSNPAELAAAATREIVSAARQQTKRSRPFRVVLAGGRTPQAVYARLRKTECEWALWQIYFGDERCHVSGDPRRNDSMARESWLNHVAIPDRQIHPVRGELGADAAATAYANLVADLPAFNLVLLGLGEDGHTASLFPGQSIGLAANAPAAVPVHHAPKPPAERVSLSAARLSQAEKVIFLVTGRDKAAAVKGWRDGQDIPAARIAPAAGVDVFVTADAARRDA